MVGKCSCATGGLCARADERRSIEVPTEPRTYIRGFLDKQRRSALAASCQWHAEGFNCPARRHPRQSCGMVSRWRPTLPVLLTFACALVAALLFPGDTPWIFDEPAEVAMAWEANDEGRLA